MIQAEVNIEKYFNSLFFYVYCADFVDSDTI